MIHVFIEESGEIGAFSALEGNENGWQTQMNGKVKFLKKRLFRIGSEEEKGVLSFIYCTFVCLFVCLSVRPGDSNARPS